MDEVGEERRRKRAKKEEGERGEGERGEGERGGGERGTRWRQRAANTLCKWMRKGGCMYVADAGEGTVDLRR